MISAMAAQHKEAAQAELDLERRRTEAERRVFDSFRKRVSAIEASEIQPDGGTKLVLSPRKLQRTSRPSLRDRVQRAYQDTVLSEPQCAEEYDESPREHMAAELGGDLLASVSEATTLTPAAKAGTRGRSPASSRAPVEIVESTGRGSQGDRNRSN